MTEERERKFKTMIARTWHIERIAEEENWFDIKPHCLYHKHPANEDDSVKIKIPPLCSHSILFQFYKVPSDLFTFDTYPSFFFLTDYFVNSKLTRKGSQIH